MWIFSSAIDIDFCIIIIVLINLLSFLHNDYYNAINNTNSSNKKVSPKIMEMGVKMS